VVHNKRMHLTGYSGLRPLPPAGDARRWTSQARGLNVLGAKARVNT
jgi:hypothetical protein